MADKDWYNEKLMAKTFGVTHGFKIEQHSNKRRKSTKEIVFFKATRGDTEPDNLNIAFACPHCIEYFDTEELFEVHHKKSHLSEKRANGGDQVILAHKKQCFSILTPVKNTTLSGPKFKSTDIERLKPFVRMAIESNQTIGEEDAQIMQDNLDHQHKLKALSQYTVQMSLIRPCDCLALNNAHEIPLLVWMCALEGRKTTNQKRFDCLVQHITTWFSSRCKRMTPHQYFNISMTKSSIYNFNDKNGYADGFGYTGQDERLLMEASSGGLEENVDHTLGEGVLTMVYIVLTNFFLFGQNVRANVSFKPINSLKLLENLAAILNTYRSKYLNSNKTTFSRLNVFGIQCIKTTITLMSVSAPGDGNILYQTPRTSQIPTTFDKRHHLLSLFELIMALHCHLLSLPLRVGIGTSVKNKTQ
ncbi:hypothetical protein EV154DRAFT_607733 [Mucor mucedo]|nr:hypothetical protein EV154DRAFT_607733 [Mucor mucedo]